MRFTNYLSALAKLYNWYLYLTANFSQFARCQPATNAVQAFVLALLTLRPQ